MPPRLYNFLMSLLFSMRGIYCHRLSVYPRWRKFYLSARNHKWNLDRMSNSSQSTRPTGWVLWEELLKEFCLFVLILYVPSTIFQLNRDGSTRVEPVLSLDKCVLLKDHNAVTPVRLEPWVWSLPLSHCAPLLKEVILHITPLCSLLHTLLKDKCMCLQDQWKL